MKTDLPTPPDPPELVWRALQLQDAEALFQLEQECARMDGSTNPPTLPDSRRKLEHVGSGLASDSLCAVDTAGRLIASAIVTFDLRLKHECRSYLDGGVHPEYRARGLGGFLLDWMEGRAREVLAAIDDDRPRVIRADWYDKGDDAMVLCQQHGFHLASAGEEMRRDLADPIPDNSLPEGLSFSTWTLQSGALFFRVYEDAFRERPGFPGWGEETWRHVLTEHDEFRADLSLLIQEGNEPVAFGVCSVETGGSDEGWINQMGVRPAWRKRGLGSALLCEIMRRFKMEGLRYAWLDVNVNNPSAARVYSRLGFVRARRYTSFRKTITPMP